MKTVFEHIEHVKGKPHHIRKRIAFTAAAGCTALVALVWLVGSISMGTFAIHGTSFADVAGGQGNVKVVSEVNGSQNLAGAAAALQGANAPAHIEIVDVASSTLPAKKAEQTTLPF